MEKKMTLKKFVKQYSGMPEGWQCIAEMCADECEECDAQKHAKDAVEAMRKFRYALDEAGFEIG